MPSSIKDVARYAGVSSATVSRVLTNKPHVREEVRARVLAAVEALGYRPNRVARSLRVQRASVIGLLISDIQNPFFTALARGVEDVAYRHGYAVFLCNSDEDSEKERFYLELMQAERVAGIVMSPARESAEACEALLEADVPLVLVDRRVPGVEVDTVLVDNVEAAQRLVAHLIEGGHTRIGGVFPDLGITTGRERLEGYRAALEAAKLPFDEALVRSGHPTEETSYRLTCELLRSAEPPTALFTASNFMTAGALRAFHTLGLRVPDDIALVAFDELDWLPLIAPDVSTIAQPTYTIGKRAVQLLLERLDDPTRALQEVILKGELHIRSGTARRAAGTRCKNDRTNDRTTDALPAKLS